MKKFQSILLSVGMVCIVLSFSMACGQEWGAMSTVPVWQGSWQVSNEVPQFPPQTMPVPPPPQQPALPAQAIPYYPAPNYAADRSLDELAQEIDNLKRELAKKSDKPDPAKGFTAPRIGGRIFMDSVNIMNQDNGGLTEMGRGKNLLGFPVARLSASGTAYDFLDYNLELGFEGKSEVFFRHVFLGINHVPVLGYVRIGNQFVEDAGSEICNPTTNFTFMDAPSPVGNQFTFRRLGVTSRHLFARNRVRMFFGAFGARDVSDIHMSNADNQGIILNTRLTHALMYQKEGRNVFLYGGYYAFTDPQSAKTNSRPIRWDLGVKTLTDDIVAENGHKMGFETAYQNGALCLQSDLFVRHFSGVNTTDDDATMYGGFVMGRYFLTEGDYRKYNLENAAWGAVVANRPFLLFQRGSSNFMQGPGAWEVATYYGFLSTDDFKNVTGHAHYGTDHQIGTALNWYWNPQLKWALNYVHQMANTTFKGQGYKPSMDIIALSCRLHW